MPSEDRKNNDMEVETNEGGERGGDEQDMETEDNDNNIRIHFRSYRPKDPRLKKLLLPKPIAPAVSKEIDDKLQLLLATPPDDQLLNLAPKKPTWDLKRDLEKKLGKLQRRTQQSIVKLVTQAMIEQENQERAALIE